MLENASKYPTSLATIVFTDNSAMADLEILQISTAVSKQD